jgi:hypothetical protein
MRNAGRVSWRRGAAARAIVFASLTLAPPVAGQGQVNQQRAVLQKIDVDSTGGEYVVTLTADGPISSQLHYLPGALARLYLDLPGVVPKVAAHTPVDRGPLVRLRVGLNVADPPVTRVVVDLTSDMVARLERGATANQLRIVIGAPIGGQARPVSSAKASPVADSSWCREIAARIEALLQSPPSASAAAAMAAQAAWRALEDEAATRSATGTLENIRFSLLQAARLGKIAAAEQRVPEQAAAARAGARLLLATAQTQLAELK